MFPTYPGFEDLPIRVEVEWQGRTRPVVANIERWPLHHQLIVVVCQFEEDAGDGEWVLLDHLGIFTFPPSGDDVQAPGAERVAKVVSIVERHLRRKLVYLGRLMELPLPACPRFALCSPAQHMRLSPHNCWIKDAIFQESFDFSASPFHLNVEGVGARPCSMNGTLPTVTPALPGSGHAGAQSSRWNVQWEQNATERNSSKSRSGFFKVRMVCGRTICVGRGIFLWFSIAATA